MSKKKWPRLHVDNWILKIDEPGQKEMMTTAEHEARLAAANERIEKLRDALSSIKGEKEQDKEAYWLKLNHASCAQVLALDTSIAREAIELDNLLRGENENNN